MADFRYSPKTHNILFYGRKGFPSDCTKNRKKQFWFLLQKISYSTTILDSALVQYLSSLNKTSLNALKLQKEYFTVIAQTVQYGFCDVLGRSSGYVQPNVRTSKKSTQNLEERALNINILEVWTSTSSLFLLHLKRTFFLYKEEILFSGGPRSRNIKTSADATV